MPLYFGGGSSSSADQSTSTETTDNSTVAAPNSTSASLNHSSGNTINITDNGAVGMAFDAVKQISQGAFTANSQALSTVTENSSAAIQQVAAADHNALAAVSDAYSTAKAGEQKVLVAAALAILGIVAIKVIK